jgi:cell wall-associated NlpC family hydrolase
LAKAQQQMGFAKAAAALMQHAAPAVSQNYANAANADAGYARGLGNLAQAPINANDQANNAFLAKMGTPAAALHPAPPVGNIAYGLQGYIPATTLQREGAAFGSAAQLFPGDLLKSGQQEAGATLANDPNLTKLYGDLGKAASEGAYRQADLGLRQQTLASENAYRGAELGLRAKTLSSENAYRQAELGLRSKSLQLSQERLNIEARRAANSNAQAWARIGIEDKRLRLEIAKLDLSARTGGLTPLETSRYRAIAQSWAQRILGPTTDPTTGKVEPQLSVKDAITEALHSGVPLSIAVNQTLATLKGHISPAERNQILREYGGLDKSIQKGVSRMLPGTSGVIGSLAFAGEKGLKTPQQQEIVQLAHEYMGTPYVWGGESPKGFDCSGFAQYLYAKAGISIPRTTYTQWQAGRPIGKGQLRPGDLVFFKGSDSIGGLPGHVGIYIGGDKMIDAPHTGSDVRIDKVSTFGGYMGARRYGNG